MHVRRLRSRIGGGRQEHERGDSANTKHRRAQRIQIEWQVDISTAPAQPIDVPVQE